MIRRQSFVVCLLALAGVLVTAGPAAANKPVKFFSRSIGFVCSDVRTSDGAVRIDVEEFTPEFDEISAGIEYWVPPETPETGEATYRSSSLITDQQITRSGYHFEGTLVIEDHNFNPVGEASFTVDLIPTSDVEDLGGRSKEGNRNIHDKSTIQFFSVNGTVTLHDGKVFDLTDCIGPDGAPSDRAGRDLTIDITKTDPSQFVLNESIVLVACDIVTETYSMNLGAQTQKDAPTGRGEAFLFTADRTIGGETSSGLSLSNTAFAGTIPMIDFDTGEELGDAVIDVTFTRREHNVLRVTQGNIRRTFIGYVLEPRGTITFPTGTVVDMSSCFAFDGKAQDKEHRPDEVPE